MSFVFLSHARPDKPKVRHIVDALIAAEFKVWLDDPAAMGFTEKEILDHFHWLEAGGQYRSKIDQALRAAGVVVVCWSENAKEDRDVWFHEANLARSHEKLVACRIDDVNKATLPDKHELEQITDLRVASPSIDTRLSLFIHDIKAKMAETAGRRIKQRVPRDAFTPYLINRTKQEDEMALAIDEVAGTGGVRAFLIAGPENECVDEFLKRIATHTCPKRLGGRSWWPVQVEWPLECTPAQFGALYQRRLAPQLGLRPTATRDEIARFLSERDQLVAVVCFMGADEWKADERERVEAWLSWWRQFEGSAPRFSAIPILKVKLPRAKPGWRHCPHGWSAAASVSRRIWREVQRLQTPAINVPPMLHPVSWWDAERWLSGNHFKEDPPELKDVKSHTSHLFWPKCRFRPWATIKRDVALEDFANAVRPLFEAG
jgi:hypothetical protein